MEKLPWMEKYLCTNTRIISIICHKWWTWCLLERAKITGKTLKYFSIHCLRVCLGWRQNTSWSRLWISFECFSWKTFFPKFELLNSGCGLSASAAYRGNIWGKYSAGKYLARGHGVRTERSEVGAPWPSAKYFPVRPDLTQSISILLHDHRALTFFFRVIKFGMFTYVAHFDRKVGIYVATKLF